MSRAQSINSFASDYLGALKAGESPSEAFDGCLAKMSDSECQGALNQIFDASMANMGSPVNVAKTTYLSPQSLFVIFQQGLQLSFIEKALENIIAAAQLYDKEDQLSGPLTTLPLLGYLLNSEMNPLMALQVVKADTNNEQVHNCCDEIAELVNKGQSMIGALQKFPEICSAEKLQAIEKGEKEAALIDALVGQ